MALVIGCERYFGDGLSLRNQLELRDMLLSFVNVLANTAGVHSVVAHDICGARSSEITSLNLSVYCS